MKRLFPIVVALALTLAAFAANQGITSFTGLPASISAGATNTFTSTQIAANAIDLTALTDSTKPLVALSASFSGVAATTNGTVVVYFVPSYDNGTTFVGAEQTYVTLTITGNGVSTVAVPTENGDFFNSTGWTRLGIGKIVNNTAGAVSNLSIKLTRPVNP